MSAAFDTVDWETEGQYKLHLKEFCIWPEQWQTYTNSHEWIMTKLERARSYKIPEISGIYILIVKPNIAGLHECSYVMYVGKSIQLHTRFLEYLGNKERGPDARRKMRRFLLLYSDYIHFCYTFLHEDQLLRVEKEISNAYIPPINEELKGIVGEMKDAWS